MVAEEIILAPVVTAKSNMDMQEGKYTFKVAKKATEVDIKDEVEKLFKVKVLSVNTMTVKGKEKRVGVHQGRTSHWKKAIVTIDTNVSAMKYLGKGGKEVKVSKKYKDSISEFMGA
jgi:large subunit ribosomal protein L23